MLALGERKHRSSVWLTICTCFLTLWPIILRIVHILQTSMTPHIIIVSPGWMYMWFSHRYTMCASATSAAASALRTPQTLHRSHDNLKNRYRIASIFDMYIDIGERIAGKQKCTYFTLGPIIRKTCGYFCPCYRFALWWGLTAWKFGNPVFDIRPHRTPQIWFFFSSYFGFEL